MMFKRICWLSVSLILWLCIESYGFDYIIGGGDTLKVSVWGSPELSTSVTVRPDGKITLPAIGEIKVEGHTVAELTRILEKEFVRVVKKPIVTVTVVNMTNYRVYVIGRGTSPGEHILNRETTLLELLATLGPLNNADLKGAKLIRKGKVVKEDFYELYEKGEFTRDIVLEPGDIIFIPDNFKNRISIVGAVQKPMTIPYRDGLTIMDVILSAGGFNEYARENSVKVLRKKDDGSVMEINVRAKDLMKKGDLKENIKMKPGDVVVVKEAIF